MLQFHSPFTISISVEADGFAQGLQSAPEPQNGMGTLLLLAVRELIRSSLVHLKVFWAHNCWKSAWSSWFMRFRCPRVVQTHHPFGTDHPQRIYSTSQREVVQQLNRCWPLKTQQRLPGDASVAPRGWRDLSVELSGVSQVLTYELMATVPCPRKTQSSSAGAVSAACPVAVFL